LSERFDTPNTVARLVLDTSDVIERRNNPSEYRELEILYEQFHVFLAKTDVVDTELDPKKNVMIRDHFLASIHFLELHGPVVLGHSRLGHSVLASDEDIQRLNRVKEIIGIRVISERAAKHDLRDAMHIATSIRYSYDGFITGEKRLLRHNAQFHSEFGFRIMNHGDAVAWLNQLIQQQISRQVVD
jgi:hypothetical protein